MKKLLLWLTVNGTYSTLLYLTFVRDNTTAGHLVAFLPWLQIPLTIFITLTFLPILLSREIRHKVVEAMKKNGKRSLPRRSVPGWVSHAVGAGFIITLAAHGWFWTAACWIVNEVLEAIAFSITRAAQKQIETLIAEPEILKAEVVTD